MKVLAAPSAQIPLRSEFLSSMVDVNEYEPASLALFGLDPQTDMPVEDVDPIQQANFIQMQSVQLPQEERVQMLISSVDEGKLLTYGRVTKMYAISGFIADSNNATNGHLIAAWDRLYDQHFRVSACLKQRRIVRFRWRLSSIYGHVLSNIKGLTADSPNVCVVNFTFLSLFEQDNYKTPIIELDDDETIEGAACYESLSGLNLVPPLAEQQAKLAALNTAVGKAAAAPGNVLGNVARGLL